MGNMIRTGGGENETRRHTASGQVSGRQEKSNMERERKRKGPMRPMPPSGHTHTQGGGRGGGGGGGAVRGGSGGQGRVQGRQHSDVSTARLPVSTRTLRGCLIGEGQLNIELIPSRRLVQDAHRNVRQPDDGSLEPRLYCLAKCKDVNCKEMKCKYCDEVYAGGAQLTVAAAQASSQAIFRP
jgi:hypothetical protein